MYTQVIGKLRLALSPFEPEWGNVPLYLTARGLTTSPMPIGRGSLDAEFDLVDHALILRTSDGGVERRPLGGAVADFHRDVMRALSRLQVDATISVIPSEVAHPVPFPEDRAHATYDEAHATRFFHVLTLIDLVLKRHRAKFRGRTTPVQFFWGTFDLALARYSGRRVAPPPDADVITRFSGDAEEVCAGWWPGDERVPDPAFYAYAFPKPEGIEKAAIEPREAAWSDTAGESSSRTSRREAFPTRRRRCSTFSAPPTPVRPRSWGGIRTSPGSAIHPPALPCDHPRLRMRRE